MAFIDKKLYQELYAISKIQSGQKNYTKWNNYDLEIDENLLHNTEKFAPIDGNNKSNAKSYRLSKNGIATGAFSARKENNNHIRIQLHRIYNINNQNQ